jgi:hypothetical protein
MSTTATPPKQLRLHRLEISNFLRIEALTVDAEGKHVVISGPNGAGKTSSIDAVWDCLKGTRANQTPEPVHRGKAKGSVKLDLGEYLVERIWTEKQGRLVVTAADGSQIRRPQELLDGLLSEYCLDPVRFVEKRPQDQVDDVLRVCAVAPPVEAVQELTGEEHVPKPGESAESYLLRLSGDDVGLFYLRRREQHRVWEQKRAALEEQRAVVGQLPKGDGEAPSATELLATIDRLQQQQQARADLADAARQAEQTVCEAKGRLAGIEEELRREDAAAARIRTELDRLQRELSAHIEAAQKLKERRDTGAAFIQEAEAELTDRERDLAATPDQSAILGRARAELRNLEGLQAQLARTQVAREQLDRLAGEAEQAGAEHARLETVLAALRELRANLLNGADLGVDGLAIGEGELLLKGIPFRQASKAESLRVACAVAMRLKPRLRLLRVDDGEHMDRHSWELLFRLADEHGFQVIATRVTDSESLRVEIVDGEAKEAAS